MKKYLAMGLIILSGAMSFADSACPVNNDGEDYLSDVEFKITTAATCAEAAQIARDCRLGSSGDGFTVASAIRNCHFDFVLKATDSDKKNFQKGMRKCLKGFSEDGGSTAVSERAFCQLEVAEKLAKKYTAKK